VHDLKWVFVILELSPCSARLFTCAVCEAANLRIAAAYPCSCFSAIAAMPPPYRSARPYAHVGHSVAAFSASGRLIEGAGGFFFASTAPSALVT
jgi:hypothetical protein